LKVGLATGVGLAQTVEGVEDGRLGGGLGVAHRLQRRGKTVRQVEAQLPDEEGGGQSPADRLPRSDRSRREADGLGQEAEQLRERPREVHQSGIGVVAVQGSRDRLARAVGAERLVHEGVARTARKGVEGRERGRRVAEEAIDLPGPVRQGELGQRGELLAVLDAEGRAAAGKRLERVVEPLVRQGRRPRQVDQQVLARRASPGVDPAIHRLGLPPGAQSRTLPGDDNAVGKLKMPDQRAEGALGVVPDDDPPLVEDLPEPVANECRNGTERRRG
jgi:hypothetical protein